MAPSSEVKNIIGKFIFHIFICCAITPYIRKKTWRVHFVIAAFDMANDVSDAKRSIFHLRDSTRRLYTSSKYDRLSEKFAKKNEYIILKLTSSENKAITSKNRNGRPRIKFLCKSLEVFLIILNIPTMLQWKETVSLKLKFKSSNHSGYLKNVVSVTWCFEVHVFFYIQ